MKIVDSKEMFRFDQMQKQIEDAGSEAVKATGDLCRAVTRSEGQLVCALIGHSDTLKP